MSISIGFLWSFGFGMSQDGVSTTIMLPFMMITFWRIHPIIFEIGVNSGLKALSMLGAELEKILEVDEKANEISQEVLTNMIAEKVLLARKNLLGEQNIDAENIWKVLDNTTIDEENENETILYSNEN